MSKIKVLSLVTEGTQRNGKTVTRAMLDSVVQQFNSTARPPITKGHPGPGADKVAALGRVDSPRLQSVQNAPGKVALVVDLHLSDELERAEAQGEFEGYSAGIYPSPNGRDWYLHHVAALGQLPPAADTQELELSAIGWGAPVILSDSVGGEVNLTQVARLSRF